MSYWDISEMSRSTSLTNREQAAAAQEIAADPYEWVAQNVLRLAAQPGWDAAWASALAAGNPDPGRDPAVITDGMILSAVQALAAP